MRNCLLAVICLSLFAPIAAAEQTLTAARVKTPPALDGRLDDGAWQAAKPVEVKDAVLGENVVLRAVHDAERVYFAVEYPDPTEDRLHKAWVWDKELSVYRIGPQREDTFSFKWDMMPVKVDLSSFGDDDYQADVWYWKANRTDPAGYADDKWDILASEPTKNAAELTSKTGKKRYLLRLGDSGDPAQKNRVLLDYIGDIENAFDPQTPSGSRADVVARGQWGDGRWTIEFGRKLQTGHDDDIQFDLESGKAYHFGISVFGLYAEPIDPTRPHLYGMGRISEDLYLTFE